MTKCTIYYNENINNKFKAFFFISAAILVSAFASLHVLRDCVLSKKL